MFSLEHPLHVTAAEETAMNFLQRLAHTLFYLPIAGYAMLAVFLIVNAILRAR